VLNIASEGEKVVTTDDNNESTNTWGPSSPGAAVCKGAGVNKIDPQCAVTMDDNNESTNT
jgi:hypothetical protein